MEASEYRIGNWVRRPVSVEDFFISPMIDDQIKALQVDNTVLFLRPEGKESSNVPLQLLRGIALSEDWLRRFGFNESGTKESPAWQKTSNGKPAFGITKRNDGALCAVNEKHKGIPVTHVHQLQNLYFELTGEDITAG